MSPEIQDALTILLGHPRSDAELVGSMIAAGVIIVLVLGRACQAFDDPLSGPAGAVGAAVVGLAVLVGGSLLAGDLGLHLPGPALLVVLTGVTVVVENKLYRSSVRTLVLAWVLALTLGMLSSRIVGVGFDFLEVGSQHQFEAADGHGDAPH